MGDPMAAHVLVAGHELMVHDIDREKGRRLETAGACWSDAPMTVASECEVVITCLPGPQEVEAVVLGDEGVFAGLAPRSTYLDTSTNRPSVMRRIADLGAKRGIHVLDAPISGGMAGAAEGTLTIFVGGAEADLERVRPLLQTFGQRIVHAGPSGCGHVVKLINNAMMFVSFLGSCEGIAMGDRAGIDPKVLLNAIAPSMGQSRIFERTLATFLAGEEFGFSPHLAAKDMRLVVELGKELGVPLEVSSRVRDVMTRFRDTADPDADVFTEMIRDYLK